MDVTLCKMGGAWGAGGKGGAWAIGGQKIKKSKKKKSTFFEKKKIEYFSENVLKTLLGRREAFRKKYGAVFEKSPKNMVFLTSKKKASPRGCF